MTTTTDRASAPTSSSRRVLCLCYGAIALIALLLTWRNGGPYLHSAAGALDFWRDAKANNSTRFFTVDILMFGLAAVLWMVIEARKWNIRFVWAYILASFLIAVSVCFPLFLIARELRMKSAQPLGLTATDKVLLPLLTAAMVGLSIWIDR